jgi:hypothetical protein
MNSKTQYLQLIQALIIVTKPMTFWIKDER